MPGDDRNEAVRTLLTRLELIDRLCQSPAHTRDIMDETGQSRSTVHRAVTELTELGFVRRGDDGIEATVTGRMARDQLCTYLERLDDVLEANAVLEPIATTTDISHDVVVGANAILTAEPTPFLPADRMHEALTAASAIRLLLPTLEESRTMRVLYEHVVTRGNPAELVVTPAVFRTLQSEFPRRMTLLAAADHFTLFVGSVPSYTLGLFEHESGGDEGVKTAVHLAVHNESGGVHGLLVNETAGAVSWASDQYEQFRRQATARTDDLIADTDGGVQVAGGEGFPMIGQSLPVSLEREGFRKLDASYFQNQPVAKPTTAWRAGLSLAEVHTGYAIPRQLQPPSDDTGTDDGTLQADITETLLNGSNAIVLGPPGSGKSTLCKQVACAWYKADRGPVVYRRSDHGRPFTSIESLVAAVTDADGKSLVVVEDAVRPNANTVFEALERLADRDDVCVLLDAREHEWNSLTEQLPGVMGLETVYVPPMDESACDQLVAHFERTLGKPIDVPAAQLWSAVREAPSGTGGAAPNEMLRLIHRLATYADPLADSPTALEETVATEYEAVADDELALSMSVLTHVLNVTGLGVDRTVLAAGVPDASPEARASVLEQLEGRYLFPDVDGQYRTVHEEWSNAFLTHVLEAEGTESAGKRFGRVVTELLAVADDAERWNAIGEETDFVGELSPEQWADETAEAIFRLPMEQSNLVPLFGDGENDTIDLPEACSPAVVSDRIIWLGEGFLAGGYYDQAERAFGRVGADRPDQAVEKLLGLSTVHTERGEYEEAIAHCEDCLSLIEEKAESLTDSRVVRARSHLQYGAALNKHNQYADAEEQYQAALDLLSRAETPKLMARALHRSGFMAVKQGQHDRARDRLDTALELAQEVGDRRVEAEAVNALGAIPWVQGENDAARERYERALELFTVLGDRHGQGKVLYNLGIIARRKGEYETARELIERCLERVREVGDRQTEVRALGSLGLTVMRQGAYEHATELLEEWLEHSVELGDKHDEARALNNLGMVAKRQGAYDRAWEQYERSLALKESFGDERGAARTVCNLAEIAILQGRFSQAEALLEDFLVADDQFDGDARRAGTLNNFGVLATRQGDLSAAADYFDRALSLATDEGELTTIAIAQIGRSELARRAGEFERATECLDAAAVAIEGIESTLEPEIRVRRARVARSAGRFDAARSHAEGALEEFEALGAPHWIARCAQIQGRIAADTGDLPRARERLEAALDTFEEIGASHEAAETVAILLETFDSDEDGREACLERARAVLSEAPESVATQYESLAPDE
ncbi:tetratricopeptide repeat protein [Natronosalvus amylolyticus]|uniref:tetratricopeptide repeat protein n=1 Tax=Natronosalvus amylolyticus TaxID=2961994 RepID=UPI0020C98110|nr:tetratricopeptide repeat protein [Natronosalvus amylolyticus]